MHWLRQKRLPLSIACLVLLLGAYAWLLQLHVEAVTYFKETPASWERIKFSHCIKWRHKFVFGDLRPESKDPYQPLELSCRQAVSLPAEQHYALNRRGQRIHYLRYDPRKSGSGSKEAERPILLYVHGIAANYVTGLKFLPMARRLGFELVLMELSNHGLSDDDGQGAAFGCREEADLVAVVADLTRREPKRPILIFGSSMGAMTIADAAKDLQPFSRNVRGVVLENPQSSLRDMLGLYGAKMHLPDFHTDLVTWLAGLRAGQDYAVCAPTERLRDLSYPALVSISEKDFMVPVWMAKKVFDHLPAGYPHQYKQYPYGEHGAVWNGQPERYEADLLAFWRQCQSLARPAI
ncbi:MAG: alpha/beta hydrolase [Candidatus Sericytochromatia bacterium]